MTIRIGAAVLIGLPFKACSRAIKSSDTQQDFVGHFAVTGFADAKAIEMVIQPSPHLLALPRTGKVHLVQDQPVREADLFPQPALNDAGVVAWRASAKCFPPLKTLFLHKINNLR